MRALGTIIVSPQNPLTQGGSDMSNHCKKPLRPNPFNAYRDPKTGEWLVIKSKRNSKN